MDDFHIQERFKLDFKEDLMKFLNEHWFAYPFDQKNDDELIQDAILRGQKHKDFAIYNLKKRSSKWVYIPDENIEVETSFIELHSLNTPDETRFFELKLSSFKFPITLLNFETKVLSKIGGCTFTNYKELLSNINNLIGCNIFVTTCWWGFPSIGRGAKPAMNIEKLPDKLEDVAKAIRYYFASERMRIINEVMENPKKYISTSIKDKEFIMGTLDIHREKLENELKCLDSFFNENADFGGFEQKDQGSDEFNGTRSHRKYEGTYAQNIERLSDDFIDDVLGGEPDAYWNID
jgi:hypothetical protein